MAVGALAGIVASLIGYDLLAEPAKNLLSGGDPEKILKGKEEEEASNQRVARAILAEGEAGRLRRGKVKAGRMGGELAQLLQLVMAVGPQKSRGKGKDKGGSKSSIGKRQSIPMPKLQSTPPPGMWDSAAQPEQDALLNLIQEQEGENFGMDPNALAMALGPQMTERIQRGSQMPMGNPLASVLGLDQGGLV